MHLRIAVLGSKKELMSKQRFAGQSALVVGGSRGIGAAVARRLAAEGAAVAVTYVSDENSANRIVDELRADGREACAFRADVTHTSEIRQLMDGVVDRLGVLNVVACCAGIEHFGALSTLTPEDFDRVFHTNVAGQLFITKSAAAAMREGGRILLMSSISARIAVYQHTLYAAAKAAVSAMALNLAPELAELNIAINALAPGGTITDMAAQVADKYTPVSLRQVSRDDVIRSTNALGRMADPNEIAAVAAFLLSSDASYITGATIDASGGR